jgi:hypothetical protein
MRRTAVTEPTSDAPRPPSPHDLADLSGPFALTAAVHDPEPADDPGGREPGPREPGPERGAPANNAPASTPTSSAPTSSAPASGAPASSAPTSGAPTSGAPVGSTTAGGAAAGGTGGDRVPGAEPGNSDETPTERGLRGLVGGGSSQVSVTAALRARDAARPRDADLAAAETDLVIIRRGWVPRDDLPRGGPRR